MSAPTAGSGSSLMVLGAVDSRDAWGLIVGDKAPAAWESPDTSLAGHFRSEYNGK